ncbi:MAG: hypothetical protein ACD_12C00086G0010 [uncultured bacterium]|nr:MAG: hypothetical protein ACD_12C00086G0010 [uncultured bacterium]
MTRFSFKQLNRASEIIGNISVAWFSGGIIAPLIARSFNFIEYIYIFLVSLFVSIFCFFLSLEIIRKN